MALRDKLRERVQPHLEPGEQIQAVFLAQTGPSPWFSMLSWLIVLFGAKYYVVAATDRAYVVLNASALVPTKVKGLDRRLPRNVRVGPLSGLWARCSFLGSATHIHKRFHGDVAQADAYVADTLGYGTVVPAGGTPGGWAPPAPAASFAAPAPASAAPAPAAAPAPSPGGTPAGWYPNPEDAATIRYFDGTAWTTHTAPRSGS